MTRARIFTGEFWTRRIDALTDGVPRMVRTGFQFAIAAIGQDVVTVDVFTADAKAIAGAFLSGCIAWLITTVVTPPRDLARALPPPPPPEA